MVGSTCFFWNVTSRGLYGGILSDVEHVHASSLTSSHWPVLTLCSSFACRKLATVHVECCWRDACLLPVISTRNLCVCKRSMWATFVFLLGLPSALNNGYIWRVNAPAVSNTTTTLETSVTLKQWRCGRWQKLQRDHLLSIINLSSVYSVCTVVHNTQQSTRSLSVAVAVFRLLLYLFDFCLGYK